MRFLEFLDKNKILFLKIVVSIILIYFIFMKAGLGRLFNAIIGINYFYLIPVFILFFLLVFFRAYKWHYLLNKRFKVDFKTSLKSLLAGMTIGLLTPGRVGELSRAIFLKIKKKKQVLSLIIFDRVVDLYIILLLATLGFLYLSFINKIYFGIFIITLICSLLITLLIFLPEKLIDKIKKKRFFNKLIKIRFVGNLTKELLEGFRIDYKTRLVVLLFSVLFYVFAFYQGLLILNSLGYNFSFLLSLIIFSAIIIATLLPISFGGLGVREGVAVLILANFMIPMNITVIFSLMWYFFTSALQAILGLGFILSEKYRI